MERKGSPHAWRCSTTSSTTSPYVEKKLSSHARSEYAPFCADVSVTLKAGSCRGSPAAARIKGPTRK